MPKPTTPTPSTPAPAAAPSTTPPATPSPAPAAAPSTPPVSTIPPMRRRATVSAANALGENDNKAILEGARQKLKQNLPPVTAKQPDAPKPEEPTVTPPADQTPAVAPAKPTPPVAPAEPPKPAKITLKGKEYTEEELARLLEKAETPPPASAPKPAEEPPKPAEPSAEQIKAADLAYKREVAQELEITPEQYEAVLAGGEEGVKAFKEVLAEGYTKARKSVFDELNTKMIPGLQRMQADLTRLVQADQQMQVYQTEQAFLAKNPDFAPHIDRAREIGQLLLQRYPEQISKMSQEQFIAEVAAQTDRILTEEYKRWNPNSAGSWREAAKAAAAVTPTGATPPLAAPPVPPVAPPAANPPAAAPTAPAPNWHKLTAASLQ